MKMQVTKKIKKVDREEKKKNTYNKSPHNTTTYLIDCYKIQDQ